MEVRDRLADRFRLLQRQRPGPERQLTLRHAVEWSYDLLSDDERPLLRGSVGIRRRLRPGERSSPSSATPTTSTCSGISTRWSASRLSSPTTPRRRTRYSLFETIRQFAEDRLADAGERSTMPVTRHADRLRRAGRSREWERWDGPGWRDAVDWVERELGNLRAALPVERERGDLDGRDRHRRACRAHGVLGAAVRDAGLGRGAARARGDGRRSHGSRGSTPRPGTRASSGEPRPPRRTRTGPPSCEPTTATTRASPATRRSSRRSARSTAAISTATSSSPGRSRERYGTERGYALAVLRRRAPVGRSHRGGARAHRGIGRRRADAREPVLDRVRAVDRGHGVLAGGRRAGRSRRGTKAWPVVREHRVQFFEGFLARDAARLHTSDGEPEAALVLFGDAITRSSAPATSRS